MKEGEFETRLMVSRKTVSELLHEKKGDTPDLAIRNARSVGGTERELAVYTGDLGAMSGRN